MPLRLRPAVRSFAEAMERKLRENDHKGGWENMDQFKLFSRIREELEELAEAIEEHNATKALSELPDPANFLMMLQDNIVSGRIVLQPPMSRGCAHPGCHKFTTVRGSRYCDKHVSDEDYDQALLQPKGSDLVDRVLKAGGRKR